MSSTVVVEQSELQAEQETSDANWEVGRLAAEWVRKYSRGLCDADFGLLVGLSADQVYRCRRVWETFGDVYKKFPNLQWAHFYAAMNWQNAHECLTWANEVQARVPEMRAWHRAQTVE